MIESISGGPTNLSRLPSTFFNLVYIVACLLESNYCKDEYASDNMVSSVYMYGEFLYSLLLSL